MGHLAGGFQGEQGPRGGGMSSPLLAFLSGSVCQAAGVIFHSLVPDLLQDLCCIVQICCDTQAPECEGSVVGVLGLSCSKARGILVP